jgi:ankyrin repeat protein
MTAALLSLVLTVGVSLLPAVSAAEPEDTKLPTATGRQVHFVRDIKPVLERSCLKCHGPEKPKSGYRVDNRQRIIKGGESDEAAIVPGKSEKSLLVHYVAGLVEDMAMPPLDNRDSNPALTSEEVGLLRGWIDQGVDWPEDVRLAELTATVVKETRAGATVVEKQTPSLLTRIRQGDIREIVALSEHDPLLNSRDAHGNSALILGAFYLDAAQLEVLLKKGFDPNVANEAGATALMWAAGDLAKTRVLLQHGAKVNAASKAGNTALTIACQQHGVSEIVEELLSHGANLHVSNQEGINALFAAARVGDENVLRILLDRGADVNSLSRPPYATATESVLMVAAQYGHIDCVELLLERGADVQFTSEYGNALHYAGLKNRSAIARLLLDRGIKVNTPGRRISSFRNDLGLTPLMYAAMTEKDDPELVQLLLDRGAAINAATESGETALGLAQQRGDTRIVRLLKGAGAKNLRVDSPAEKPPPLWMPEQIQKTDSKLLKRAAEKGLALVLQSGVRFTEATANRCSTCHQQAQPALAFRVGREKHISYDRAAAEGQLSATRRGAERRTGLVEQPLPVPSIAAWLLIGLDASGHAPDLLTDTIAHSLARIQAANGRWISKAHRPPTDYSDVSSTALALRALTLYTPPTMKAEFAQRTARAAKWLQAYAPSSTEERAFQLLGLRWAGSAPSRLTHLTDALLHEQRENGGWAQLATLDSDAYATGLALYALHEAGGLQTTHSAYERGLRFLLRTQLGDGSWLVKTRASPVQVAIDNIFSHGTDQWMSTTATSWSAIALMLAVAN